MSAGTQQRPYRKMGEMNEIYFDAPKGLELEGDSGESLIRWKKAGDRYMITAIDGVKTCCDEEEPESSPTEDEGSDEAPQSGY